MSGSKLPSVDDLKKQLQIDPKAEKASQGKFVGKFKREATQAQAEYIHLTGLNDHYKHKGKWSYFLMFLLFLMILFQCILLRQVGLGHWDFTKYEWLLPILLVQNLGQIISLAFVVVKSLFKDL